MELIFKLQCISFRCNCYLSGCKLPGKSAWGGLELRYNSVTNRHFVFSTEQLQVTIRDNFTFCKEN